MITKYYNYYVDSSTVNAYIVIGGSTMKLRLVKCGICETWHRSPHHCAYCGAYRFTIMGKTCYFNRAGVEMVRGEPISLHRTLERVIRASLREMNI